MEKDKYIIEFTRGQNILPESRELETYDINWRLDQIGRHRNNIHCTKVERI